MTTMSSEARKSSTRSGHGKPDQSGPEASLGQTSVWPVLTTLKADKPDRASLTWAVKALMTVRSPTDGVVTQTDDGLT